MDYDLLVSLARNPTNFGKLENATYVLKGKNASCGDSVTIYLAVENDAIKDAKFEGEGCMLSKAATSLLLKHLVGKSISEINKLDLEYVEDLLEFKVSIGRIKCVLLPVDVLKSIVHQK